MSNSPGTSPLPLPWVPREPPLAPTAVLALAAVVAPLCERLLRLDEPALQRLRGVAGAGVLVVIGDSGDLPWIDGLRYLGCDPAAPGLWLPTLLKPDVPVTWLAQLFAQQRPCALWPAQQWIIPLHAARPLTRERLATVPGLS